MLALHQPWTLEGFPMHAADGSEYTDLIVPIIRSILTRNEQTLRIYDWLNRISNWNPKVHRTCSFAGDQKELPISQEGITLLDLLPDVILLDEDQLAVGRRRF